MTSLGGAVAVGGGGVDERAAGVEEDLELLGGLVLVGVPAPRHGAQADVGDRQTCATDPALLHGITVSAATVRPVRDARPRGAVTSARPPRPPVRPHSGVVR